MHPLDGGTSVAASSNGRSTCCPRSDHTIDLIPHKPKFARGKDYTVVAYKDTSGYCQQSKQDLPGQTHILINVASMKTETESINWMEDIDEREKPIPLLHHRTLY